MPQTHKALDLAIVALVMAAPAGAMAQQGNATSAGGAGTAGAADPNAVPTLNNSAGIDTSLSIEQSARDPNVATETQQRYGNGTDNSFDWACWACSACWAWRG